MTPSIPQKTCSKCGNTYPATPEYFYRQGSKLRSNCKACSEAAKREWRKANPEKVKQHKSESQKRHRDSANRRAQRYYERHPEQTSANRYRNNEDYRAKRKIYEAQYHKDHAEKKCAMSREWHANNKERAHERSRQWAKDHPEQNKILQRKGKTNRRAREYNAEGSYTPADVREMYEQQNGLCGYCGIRLFDKWHEDHIVPLSRGGSNYPDNIMLCCPNCNLSKSDKLLSEWIAVRGW